MKNIWKYHQPTFDYQKKYGDLESAWIGHRYFVYDLISNIKPKTIVELGTHKGGSFFSFCQAVKDKKLSTKLYAIDTWKGDEHTGNYSKNTYQQVQNIHQELYPKVKIKLIKKLFVQALDDFHNKSIDILHIDGFHTYKAVKNDLTSWLPKVKKNGIILLHDTEEKKKNFGVHIFWDEIKDSFQTLKFDHSHGLGVIINKKNKIWQFHHLFSFWQHYYSLTNQEQVQLQQIETLKIQLTQEKETSQKQFHQIEVLNQHISDQTKIMNNITSAKTFKLWQLSTKIRQNPYLLIRSIKLLFTKGPTFLVKKITTYQSSEKKNMSLDAQYQIWKKNNYPSPKKLARQRKKQLNFLYRPKISIIIPVYNTDPKWLKKCFDSVINQTYNNWELCLADDASTKKETKTVLEQYQKKYPKKIKLIFRKKNGHICQASNSALKLSTGEFIALLDHDDEIKPHALYSMVKHLNKNPETDMIYSDEDKVEENGQNYTEPHFKPDWSPDTFNSMMYTCHFGLYRKKIIDQIGGFRPGYEGSQDYDLVLRFSEKSQNIHHIPDILYTWRKIPGSTSIVGKKAKPYAYIAAKKALNSALKRKKIKGIVKDGAGEGLYRIEYKLLEKPLISIIIPTKDKVDYLKKCINSILKKTTYKNYQILITDNASTNPSTFKYYRSIKKNKKIKIVHWNKRYNSSAINNFAAKKAKGEYLLFLNNNTEIITPMWIESMLEHAQRKEIGAVGAKLLFPDKSIQHAGIILGLGKHRIAGHIFAHHQGNGYFGYASVVKNYSAVTADCMLISKEKFQTISGFDPSLENSYTDVDLCLKLRKKGYLIVYTPFAQLYRRESTTLRKINTQNRNISPAKENIMKKRWERVLLKDPYYNPNLSLDNNDCSLKL